MTENKKTLDFRSETGMSVILIDGMLGFARMLVNRDWSDLEVQEALLDLRSDDDMKRLMDIGELSDAKAYIEEQRKTIKTLTDALEFVNKKLKA